MYAAAYICNLQKSSTFDISGKIVGNKRLLANKCYIFGSMRFTKHSNR